MRHKMTEVGMLAGTLALFAAGAFAYPRNLTTLAAMQLYDVREMLAALLLFSVLFAVIAVVILILFLLDRCLYRVLALTESYTAQAAQRLHRFF
jgi:hypothetical protein